MNLPHTTTYTAAALTLFLLAGCAEDADETPVSTPPAAEAHDDGLDDHEGHEADEEDHADHEEHGPGEHGAAAPTRLHPTPAGSPRTAITRSN